MEELLNRQARENGRLFFSIANNILHNAEAAEDACQQAFLKAFESADSIRSPKSLKGWLAKTVVNESLQVIRRRQVEARYVMDKSRKSGDYSEIGEEFEKRESVKWAMAQLPEDQRTVVVLRKMQGMCGAETAKILGISEPEVSRKLCGALETMRLALLQENEHPGRIRP